MSLIRVAYVSPGKGSFIGAWASSSAMPLKKMSPLSPAVTSSSIGRGGVTSSSIGRGGSHELLLHPRWDGNGSSLCIMSYCFLEGELRSKGVVHVTVWGVAYAR